MRINFVTNRHKVGGGERKVKIVAKVLLSPAVLLMNLMVLCGAYLGTFVYVIFSVVSGLAGFCAILAWTMGDKMALPFMGIGFGFFLAVLLGKLFAEKCAEMVEKLNHIFKTW